jgi:hypothetical protein
MTPRSTYPAKFGGILGISTVISFSVALIGFKLSSLNNTVIFTLVSNPPPTNLILPSPVLGPDEGDISST